MLEAFKLRVAAIIQGMSEVVDDNGGSVEDFLSRVGIEVLVLAAFTHRGSEQAFLELAQQSFVLARQGEHIQ
jgi:hypothetical protein